MNPWKRFWKSGEPFIWLTGGALTFSLLMVAGLLLLVLASGLGFFWPREVTRVTLRDGTVILGEIAEREAIPQPGAPPAGRPPAPARHRIKVKQGNRDLTGADFVWVDEANIATREKPPDTVVVERREWGNFYGVLRDVREGDRVVAEGPEAGWAAVQSRLPQATRVFREIRRIEKKEIGGINHAEEKIRLRLKRLELQGTRGGPEV
ncbi:MAG: phosphate ABC transporter, permease protein PstA, partial [candidate division NC10 bacterium]|nr:phosphate ABC transporter, permease protein PstA [candidate division NC10 bacterium]